MDERQTKRGGEESEEEEEEMDPKALLDSLWGRIGTFLLTSKKRRSCSLTTLRFGLLVFVFVPDGNPVVLLVMSA